MSGILLIRDLAVVMVVAGGAAWLCHRIGLSVVVGYLVAGAIIGPHTPPFQLVSNLELVQTLAQVGLVFLVFSIGLNLSISRLRRLGGSLVVATVLGVLGVLLGCRLVGFAAGATVLQSLFLASVLMVSSSAIISKVLDELNLTHERAGQMALGLTVLEDVVAVIMLTLLTSLIQVGGAASATLLPTVGRLAAFVLVAAILSLLLVPKLLARLSEGTSMEIRTVVVTGLVLGLGWLAFQMGYSLALGAFVLGAIVGSTRYKADIDDVFEGVRHIFGAVFFVAVGMLVDFKLLAGAWHLVLAVAALALILRPVACGLGLLAVGNGERESIQAAIVVMPLGEFSFIIAQLGVDSGAMPASFFPVAVGASLITSLVAPAMAKRSERIADRVIALEPAYLRNWGTVYHDWLTRLRSRQSASVLWRLTARRWVQVGVSMLVVSALILMAQPTFAWARTIAPEQWLFPMGPTVVFWTVFGFVILAPLIAIWRNVSALAMILAEWVTQGGVRERRYRPFVEFALRTVGLVVLVSWLLVLLPTSVVFLSAAVSVVALLGIVTLIFRRRLVRLHSRLEITLLEQFRRASQKASASAWAPGLDRSPQDWEVEIDEVTLPSDSALAGRTLGQLALRKRFSCSVVGIDRQGFPIVNPVADTVLYPRDKLLVLGATEDLDKVARILGGAATATTGPSGFEELTMETVGMPDDSTFAGKTLIELDLIRRAGIQIGGIRRGKQRMIPPSGRDKLEAADELLVLGTPEKIQRFRALLSPETSSNEPQRVEPDSAGG